MLGASWSSRAENKGKYLLTIMNPSLENKTILITGGMGFFGKVMAEELILNHDPKKIIIYTVMS